MKKLFVGNLTYSVTDDTLMQLFVDRGYQVSSARIIMDRETGRSRGFGFVELADDEAVAKAITELHGMDSGGRALQVNEAREQESRGGGNRFGGGRGFGGGHSGRGGRGNY